jgi:hypothetical protein
MWKINDAFNICILNTIIETVFLWLITFFLVCTCDWSTWGIRDTVGAYVEFPYLKFLSTEVSLIGILQLYNCELMFFAMYSPYVLYWCVYKLFCMGFSDLVWVSGWL